MAGTNPRPKTVELPGEGQEARMRKILVALTVGVVVGVGVPTATADSEHDVEIRDGAFVPERLEVRVGDTVEWRNEGQGPHSVTADDGAFDSGPLDPGGDFDTRFDAAGTYRYRSTAENDESMVAVVVVLPADDGGSSDSTGEGSLDKGEAEGSAESGSAGGAESSEGPAGDSAAKGASRSSEARANSRSPSVSSGGPVLAQAAAVSVQDDVFVPSRVVVDAGGTVVWQHAGQRPHTVTASDGSFDSGNLETGDSFSRTFSQPGEYPYYCRFHGSASGQGMAGVVVVQGAPGDADGEAPGTGEQTGGLAATGSGLVVPVGAAVALLGAGLWLVRRSGSGLSPL
jgi:plastocyanin